MDYQAEFTFDLGDRTEIVYRSICPELDNAPSNRSKVSLSVQDSVLHVDIRANDVVMLRAAVNTWLRLIKTAGETTSLKKEP